MIRSGAPYSSLSPVFSPQIFPYFLRKLCCLVYVEYKNSRTIGSGTLTKYGILTASHLFNKENPQSVLGIFLTPQNFLACVYLGERLYENKELDVTILEAPQMSTEFSAAELVSRGKNEPIQEFFIEKLKKNQAYAFGCPRGILGIVWKPFYVAHDEQLVYTTGLACGGISGGGILVKKGKKWYVLAIHIGYHTAGQTLLSAFVTKEQVLNQKPDSC